MALALYSVGQNRIEFGLLLAGAVVVVVPALIVFLVLQRQLPARHRDDRTQIGDSCDVYSSPSSPSPSSSAAAPPAVAGDDRGDRTLRTYARDTWRSVVAMTDPGTGLVADNIEGDLAAGSRSAYTSPTNIGVASV